MRVAAAGRVIADADGRGFGIPERDGDPGAIRDDEPRADRLGRTEPLRLDQPTANVAARADADDRRARSLLRGR